MTTDYACLSYWCPALDQARIPIPKTIVHTLPEEVRKCLYRCGCEEGSAEMADQVRRYIALEIQPSANALGAQVGWPLFLRSGHTSAKHEWKNTCCLQRDSDIFKHMCAIVLYGELASFVGLPISVWVLREMLKTRPSFHAFDGMPIVREYRYFMRGDHIHCCHPYWPAEAIQKPTADNWRELLGHHAAKPPDEVDDLARRAGAALGAIDGSLAPGWSVDILETERGWFVTDCAPAAQSWHWPDCPNASA